MNWFTKNHNEKITEWVDMCDHLKEGDKAHVVHTEMDSFGVVGKIALCKECEYKRIKEEEINQEIETTICFDCKQEKVLKEVSNWTPYDYYPQQGDIPTPICNECWDKEKHQNRMAQDAACEEREFY